jgi:hypothetical protein
LRDAPQPAKVRHLRITLKRQPAAPDCVNSGSNPIVLTGVVRYPLATAERQSFPVDHRNVELENFWEVEKPDEGAFVWSRDRSTVAITGLDPGTRYRVTLVLRDAANAGNLNIGPDMKHLERAVITPGRTAACPEPLAVSTDGKLRIAFESAVWSPSVLFHSEDQRALGVALRLITLDKVEAPSGLPHEHR